MFRVLLAALFALALVAPAGAQDKDKKDDVPKVEKNGDDTATLLKEIRDELRATRPAPTDLYAEELSWKQRFVLAGEKVMSLAPIILLVLIAVVLIGLRSDMNDLLKGKKVE